MSPINDLGLDSGGNGIQPNGIGCTAVGVGCKFILCNGVGLIITQPVASTLLVAAAKTVSVWVDK